MSRGHPLSRYLLLTLFVLAPAWAAAEVSGAVLDPHGAPVPGALVRLIGGVQSRSVTTDSQGRFQFPALPDGAYTLFASSPGLSAAPQKITVRGGEARAEVRLSLAARNEMVVVTAERAELPVSSVGSSTTVITREQLNALHPENVAEALRYVPGLSVVDTGRHGGVTSVFARGGNSNYNLVMIDGVQVNDFGGAFNFASLPVEGVERIEVVRGPQTALYGLNAIGSVINVITHRPAEGIAVRGEAAGGSYGAARGSFGAGGREGRFGWNFDLMRDSSDGVVPNDYYRNEAGSLRLEFETSASSRLRYTLLADANDVGAPGPYSFIPVDTTTRGKENSYTNGLEFEVQRGRFLHKLTAGFYNDSLGFVSDFGPYHTRQFRGSLGTESSVALAADDVLAFGFDYQRERFQNTFITNTDSTDFPLTRNNFGWYAENRYERGGRLFLNTGLRLQQIQTSAVPADAFGSRPAIAAHTITALSPKVSLAFLPAARSGSKLHASAGTGLRAPDGFELAFTDNPVLRPERTTSFDAGFEQQFARRRVVVDATYFYNRYRDLIVTLSGPLSQLSRFQSDNLANSRAQGIEFSAGARPAEWVSLNGTYTWLKSELLSLDHAPGQVLAPFHLGQELLRRPEHSASYMITWYVRRWKLTLNTGAYMRSAILDVHPVFGPGGGLFQNGGYISPDVGAEVALNREVSLFGKLYNFSDSRYEEALGFPALRRNFVAGLKFRWR